MPHHRRTTANGDGLAALLRLYIASRRSSGSTNFVNFVRQRNPHVFSHHDRTRADYADHVWRCGGFHLCRGCTAAFIATAAGFAAGMATRWPTAFSTTTIAVIFTGLLLLAHLPLPAAPRTLLHDLRRAALGVLLGSAAAYLILADGWLPRVIVVAVYIGTLVARRLVRRRDA